MTIDGGSNIPEVLERIRARLRTRAEADLRAEGGIALSNESSSADVGALRQRLGAIVSAHRQVGEVNPRHPGPINSLIQTSKRFLRRILMWYTRPNVEFQAHTIQFLNDTAEIFGHEQSRLAGLEKKIEALTADLADLRQQVQSALDSMTRDQGKSKRDER